MSIQKLTINKIWIDPKPTQYGSFKTNFKFKEYGDKWISGFAKETKWREGDVVEIDVHDNEKGTKDKEGNVYMNWKFVSQEKKIEDEIAQIKFSIANIHKKIDEIVKHIKMKEDDGRNSDGSLPPNFDNANAELETLAEEENG